MKLSLDDIIVYSANIGEYDKFHTAGVFDKNARYILFTDSEIKSKNWEIQKPENTLNLSDRKLARYYKLNPHLVLPEHKISIWIDSCFEIQISDFEKFLVDEDLEKNDILIYKHPWRDCLYDEAAICKEKKLDYDFIIDEQIFKYKNDGFPENFGLFATGIILRKNIPEINKFNEMWWVEVLNHSGRDQLSQQYAAWKTNTKIKIFKNGSCVYNTPYMSKKIKHIKNGIF